MSSTLGGDDPAHDLPEDEKDTLEAVLHERARIAKLEGKMKLRNMLIARSDEVSRPKSKRAHGD